MLEINSTVNDPYIGLCLISIAMMIIIISFYGIFLHGRIKSKEIEFGVLLIMSVLILYLLSALISPLKEKTIIDESVVKLNIEDYVLYNIEDRYLAMDRVTGNIFDSTAVDYIRYELCYDVELYQYDVKHKLGNGFISFVNIDTISEVLCLNKEK